MPNDESPMMLATLDLGNTRETINDESATDGCMLWLLLLFQSLCLMSGFRISGFQHVWPLGSQNHTILRLADFTTTIAWFSLTGISKTTMRLCHVHAPPTCLASYQGEKMGRLGTHSVLSEYADDMRPWLTCIYITEARL